MCVDGCIEHVVNLRGGDVVGVMVMVPPLLLSLPVFIYLGAGGPTKGAWYQSWSG